ncbi:MAG: DUF2975 domain-containing protein [Pseudomonadota bacterium]
MQPANFEKIRSVSRILVVVSTLGLVGLALLAATFTLVPALLVALAEQAHPDVSRQATISLPHHLGILAASLLSLAASAYILWHIRALFAAFAAGEVFSARPPHHIHRIGWGLIAATLVQIVSPTLTVLFLSLGNPPGEKMLSLSLGSAHAGLIFFGLVMITLGWVLKAASGIAAENRQFI